MLPVATAALLLRSQRVELPTPTPEPPHVPPAEIPTVRPPALVTRAAAFARGR